MANIKFFYDNLWKEGTIVYTSQHENFPAARTQGRDFNKQWRSQHGAGSGWGNFVITAAVNDRLDYEDSVAGTWVAYLTAGSYTADELATHIETQLEATASPDVFTVEYLETSNKFKITDDSGTFKLLLNTGANKSRSIADTIGFDDSADLTGADNYNADEVRIHSEELLTLDLESAQNIYGIEIRGHNFSAAATVEAIFSDDNWATIDESPDFTVQDDILILQWDTPKNYRYVGIRIQDRENPVFYVAIGVISVGGQLQPTTDYLVGFQRKRIDPSEIHQSEGGQKSSIQLSKYWTFVIPLRIYGSSELANFESMEAAVGTSKPFFVCFDPDSPLTTTYYVQAVDWDWLPIKASVDHWQLTISVEEERET